MNFLQGKGFKASQCKTHLRMATSRIKLLRNKRDIQVKGLKKDIAQLLSSGNESSASMRVEHVIREQKLINAYDAIEIFTELVVKSLPIIEKQKTCPSDLKEAISSLIFAAPRCADLPELAQVRTMFQTKYGKEFIAVATELRTDCGVNRRVIEKLSVQRPTGQAKLNLMKEIAAEHKVVWDAASLEKELTAVPDDLLRGPSQFTSAHDMPIEEFPSVPSQKPQFTTQTLQPPQLSSASPTSLPDYPVSNVPTKRPPPRKYEDGKQEIKGTAPIEKHVTGSGDTQTNDAAPYKREPSKLPPQVPDVWVEKSAEHARRHSLGSAADSGSGQRETMNERSSRRASDRFPAQFSESQDAELREEVKGSSIGSQAQIFNANRAAKAAEVDRKGTSNGGVPLADKTKHLQSCEKGSRLAPVQITTDHETDTDGYITLSDGDFDSIPLPKGGPKVTGLTSLREVAQESEDSEDGNAPPLKEKLTQETSFEWRNSRSKSDYYQESDQTRLRRSDDNVPDEGFQERGSGRSVNKPLSQDHGRSDSRRSRDSQNDDANEYSSTQRSQDRNYEPQPEVRYTSNRRLSLHEPDVYKTNNDGSRRRSAGWTKSKYSAEDYIRSNSWADDHDRSEDGSHRSGSVRTRPENNVFIKNGPNRSHYFDEERVDAMPSRKTSGKARPTDDKYHNRGLSPSYDDDSFAEEGSRGRVSGRRSTKKSVEEYQKSTSYRSHGSDEDVVSDRKKSKNKVEEYHMSTSGRSGGSGEERDRVRGKESRKIGTTNMKPKYSRKALDDHDQVSLWDDDSHGKVTTRVKSSSLHENRHDNVRSSRNDIRASASSSSSEGEKPLRTKNGGKGADKISTSRYDEVYRNINDPSHGSEDDAILPSGKGFGQKRAPLHHDQKQMSSLDEEDSCSAAAERRLKPQPDESWKIKPRKVRDSEVYPSSPSKYGSSRNASGRTSISSRDGHKRETTVFNSPPVFDEQEYGAALLQEERRRIPEPSYDDYSDGEWNQSAGDQRSFKGTRREILESLKLSRAPRFADESEDSEFEGKVFVTRRRPTQDQVFEKDDHHVSGVRSKDVFFDRESTSEKRMSLPGGLTQEKSNYRSSRVQGTSSAFDDYAVHIERPAGRRFTVGGEELRGDVTRHSDHYSSKTKATAARTFEDSRTPKWSGDVEEPQANEHERKRLPKHLPKTRDTYPDDDRMDHWSQDTSVERDMSLDQQGRSRGPSNHFNQYPPSMSNLSKLKVGKKANAGEPSSYDGSHTPSSWVSRGEKSLKFVSSSGTNEPAQPKARARSSLAMSKASSDSWAQQKRVPVQDHRRTQSAAAQEEASRDDVASTPRLQKFSQGRTSSSQTSKDPPDGLSQAKPKLIRPPEFDEFYAKINRNPS